MQRSTERAIEREREDHLSTEQLYRAHRPFVERFLARLGVRREVLDDAVQDVFVTVHRRGGYVYGPATPTSYLATIAVNAAAAQRRTLRTQRARSSEREPEQLAAAGIDPGKALEMREELARVERALSRLDPALRETLLRADGEGETCVAIAEASSVPLGTVYWRLDRARKKFQEALRKSDVSEPAARGRSRVGMLAAIFGGGEREAHGLWCSKLLVGVGTTLVAASGAWFAMRAHPTHTSVQAEVVLPHASAQQERHPEEPRVVATAQAPQVVDPVTRALSGRASARAVEKANAPTVVPAQTPSLRAADAQMLTDAAPATRGARAERWAGVSPSRKTRPTARGAAASTAERTKAELERSAQPQLASEPSEAQRLARAEALLVSEPERALELVRALELHSETRYLREERDYVEVMALLASDREQAREQAERFLRSYPRSALARAVELRLGRSAR